MTYNCRQNTAEWVLQVGYIRTHIHTHIHSCMAIHVYVYGHVYVLVYECVYVIRAQAHSMLVLPPAYIYVYSMDMVYVCMCMGNGNVMHTPRPTECKYKYSIYNNTYTCMKELMYKCRMCVKQQTSMGMVQGMRYGVQVWINVNETPYCCNAS